MVPVAINMKQQNAIYLATDISPLMVDLAKQNVRKNYEIYDSKQSYDDWLKNINVEFKVANGEEPIVASNKEKFDRIICNFGLHLTEDPAKMLQNFYNISTDDCLVGVSIPGLIDENPSSKLSMQLSPNLATMR